MTTLIELGALKPLSKGQHGELRQTSSGWTLHIKIAGVVYTVRPKHPPARARVFKTAAAAIRAAKYCEMKDLILTI